MNICLRRIIAFVSLTTALNAFADDNPCRVLAQTISQQSIRENFESRWPPRISLSSIKEIKTSLPRYALFEISYVVTPDVPYAENFTKVYLALTKLSADEKSCDLEYLSMAKR